MKGTIFIFYNLIMLIFPISFIVSLKKTRKPTNFTYMNGFYYYSLLVMLVLVFFILKSFHFISMDLFLKVNAISFIYHYYFFARFINKVITKNLYNKSFIIISNVFFVLTIITSIFSIFYLEYRGFTLTVANIGLIVLALFYYNFLLDDDNKINLKKEPSFYVITGIVLGMSFNIPFHSLSKQILESYQEKITHWIVFFGGLGYLLMHLFFIKASFLCTTLASEK